MEEVGQVLSRDGDLVSVEVKGAIESCSSCSSCLSTIADEPKSRVLNLSNSIDADIGDFVVIELNEGSSILLSILLYVFPILMMLFGYFIGDELSYEFIAGKLEDNILAIGLSFVFLFFGLGIVYFVDKFLSRKANFSPSLKCFYKFE